MVMCVHLLCAADAEHAPIKVGEFSEKIALVRAEDDEGLEDEYAVSGVGCGDHMTVSDWR